MTTFFSHFRLKSTAYKELMKKGAGTSVEEACESLRGNLDASEFKEYVIAMLFLKRVNDQFALERQMRKGQLEPPTA